MPSFFLFFVSALAWTSNLHQRLCFRKAAGGQQKKGAIGIIIETFFLAFVSVSNGLQRLHSARTSTLSNVFGDKWLRAEVRVYLCIFSYTVLGHLFVPFSKLRRCCRTGYTRKPSLSFWTCCSGFKKVFSIVPNWGAHFWWKRAGGH